MAKASLANLADTQQISTRITRILPSSPRKWGTLTPHEMICHLSDSFLMVMGEKRVAPMKISVTPIPLPIGFVKWFALEVPMRWPQGTPTLPEVDPKRDGTRPTEFGQDVENLQSLLKRFTRQPRDFQFAMHPIFGTMCETEWMRWGFLHMDHHLRQFGV